MNLTHKHAPIVRRAIAAIGLTSAISFGAVVPANSADYSFDSSYTWQMTMKEAYANTGRTFLLAELNSLMLPQPDTPLAMARVMTCPAVLDLGSETFGFCVQTDTDGDQIFVAISSVPAPQEQWAPGATGASAGLWRYTGGTGKYEGITGEGTYTASTMMSLNGSVWGYSVTAGNYAMPD